VKDTPADVDHPPSGEPAPIADPYVIGPLRRLVPPSAPTAAPAKGAAGRRSSWLVTAGLGAALVLSWGTGIGSLVQRAFAPPAVAPIVRSARSATPSRRAAGHGFVVPKATTPIAQGAVSVVDVGVDASSLADALAQQRAAARDAGETMLVMTTSSDCEPCESLFNALPDPRMQAALARVRLVRVDLRVFRDDLDSLQIPRNDYPGFFVLGPDLRPRDGMDAGEWDANIPENMAPVLSAFVRGQVTKRRTPWQALPGAGMRL